VEGLKPGPRGGVSKLRILDPACGSGSFLLGAYQFLLDWHLEQYAEEPERWKDVLVEAPGGGWRLTTAERKRILLNNIYGVDIDPQAVEVTKLSLLLKVLEGENEQTLERQFALFHQRALPDLVDNIKSGNSLIGPNFYEGKQLGLLDEEERWRINAFDWKAEFPEIMKSGGFDAVIGNPPYVRSQGLEATEKAYYARSFSAAAYQPDLFAFFVEKGVQLLGKSGRLGFIIPNGVLTNTYYAKLRRYLLANTAIEIIVDLKSGVFGDASVDTSIFVLRRITDPPSSDHRVRIGEYPARLYGRVETPTAAVEQHIFGDLPDTAFNTSLDPLSAELTGKILAGSVPLGSLVEAKAGMKVRKDFVGEIKGGPAHRPFLVGSDVKPFSTAWQGQWVHYDKSLEEEFSNQAFRDERIFTAPAKLLVRQILGNQRIYATLDSDQFFVDQSLYVLLPKDSELKLPFILGILASKLMAYYFGHTLADRKVTFPKIKAAQIKQLPIRLIDFSDPPDVERHDRMVSLVEQMLALHEQTGVARTTHDRQLLRRQIEASDGQIDRLVYELYGLTEEEIAIVERGIS
jgi:hypothetical protein